MTEEKVDAPLKTTALHASHGAAGARLVPFAGWEMPLHYGSQVEEHHQVRRGAGMFDVSHMTVIDLRGAAAEPFLARVLANDVGRIPEVGQAQYGAMLNEAGGVIDDLIAYRRSVGFRLVTNAGTRDRVVPWLESIAAEAPFRGSLELEERPDLAMIAVQGPRALAALREVLKEDVAERAASFRFYEVGERMVARTGYTGEDGAELILPAADAGELWQRLRAADVAPIGLAARDTLRLEAGLNLYGIDMDERVSPWAANLGWTLALNTPDRDFIGRSAVVAAKTGELLRQKGLVMQAKGVLRGGYRVTTDAGDGVITSGLFSPTLGYSIAFARLPKDAGGTVRVDIRGKAREAQIVKAPFVRAGVAAWR
ncbi:MAG: glycine cleavage system aminomethyltransferase GcvT [Pseudomonadota bacterium]